jgi:hypothetical protein
MHCGVVESDEDEVPDILTTGGQAQARVFMLSGAIASR